jgi:hypothetical protein
LSALPQLVLETADGTLAVGAIDGGMLRLAHCL